MRNPPSLMFAVRTAMAALLVMIIGAGWALIVNQRVLTSTTSIPAVHQNMSSLLPSFTPIPPPVTHPLKTVYRVRPGDTLWGISKHAGVTWETLYALNRRVVGGNPNLIYPGETLQI
jgi:nucleoid-associated protein YgaU